MKNEGKVIPAVRRRKNYRMLREKVALCESIYNNVTNIKNDNYINVTVGEIEKEEDGNIFGYWDKEIKTLI